ncbi:MAG: Lrp/AsnC ligand binding domain-containing protein [Candidatus Thermoplasmatota archaeon]|nr:Lrp/AsnC ligand binding domain-containing protein [Candidatus Thermoplasmatota archaeon]
MAIGYVLIATTPEYDNMVYKELQRVSEIVEVYGTAGEYNILVKIVADDIDSISEVVVSKIRKISGVTFTDTLPVIEKFSEHLKFPKATVGKNTEFLLVNTQPPRDANAYNEISKLQEIIEAYMVFGKYDIIVKVGVENVNVFLNYLMPKVRKISGVVFTKSLITRAVV